MNGAVDRAGTRNAPGLDAMPPVASGPKANRAAVVFLLALLAIAGLEVWAIASGLASLF
jgi:hypothetical protein